MTLPKYAMSKAQAMRIWAAKREGRTLLTAAGCSLHLYLNSKGWITHSVEGPFVRLSFPQRESGDNQ